MAIITASESLTISETEFRVFTPPDTAQLDEAIEESRQILELRDNWDGEGGESYLESTWQRAVDFLYTLSVTPDGKKLLAGGQSGNVRIWTLADGKLVHELK